MYVYLVVGYLVVDYRLNEKKTGRAPNSKIFSLFERSTFMKNLDQQL